MYGRLHDIDEELSELEGKTKEFDWNKYAT